MKLLWTSNLGFKIQTFTLFVPPDHDIYTTYKNWVKNITLTSLIKVCSDVENKLAKKFSSPHEVIHNIKHFRISLNKPNIYLWLDLCDVLAKTEQTCKSYQKCDNFCTSKQIKSPRDSQ